ncbi:MAG: hypothetical protein HWN66_07660 [Candidatus Helarchaeota archaeon]|nr:hypothetical protein [Candidatus Helarchaeota archaeon]
MIYWALLLHIYQPPFQNIEILQKVEDESYSKVLDVFLKFPKAKFTLNINGSLTELLYNFKFFDTLNKIKELAQKGQLKFTGSGKYHPILPLLPPAEIMRQIYLNEEYNKQILGPIYESPKGFFPPELAISRGVLDILEQLRYKWVLASGIACPTDWPISEYYTYKSLPILFRDDIVSNQISFKKLETPEEFLTKIRTMFDDNYYIITAMDGETYGHHIENYEEEFLGAVFAELEDKKEIQMIFLDDILNLFEKGANIIPNNSTWSTIPKNLQEKNPYPLWADPENKIHEVLNHLRSITIKLWQALERYTAQIPEDHLEFYNTARLSLDKGENSDGAWWASGFIFNEDLIFRSSQFLVRSSINAFKALYSIALKSDEISEIHSLYEDFKGTYAKLLFLLANETEKRSRFKSFTRRIDNLPNL